MKLKTYHYNKKWDLEFDTTMDSENTLILVFGSSNIKYIDKELKKICQMFPQSTLFGASTAGEIVQDTLFEDTISITIIKFENTVLKKYSSSLLSTDKSYNKGKELAKSLMSKDLKAILVLSDGLLINGSQLTNGISSILENKVIVTGGLAGDSERFEKTWVIDDNKAESGSLTAIGLYGNAIQVLHGSKGGWDRLGLQRTVTKSKDNILYEIDNQPALNLYKKYLAEKAKDLPASGLLFPLEIEEKNMEGEYKVRTILGVNEEEKSITFAGDIPEGCKVTLMKANFDRLIDGAAGAAENMDFKSPPCGDTLNIAISCVGRKLVLKQRVEEELEAVLDELPKVTSQVGFYSYGEISPLDSGVCDLHNQTMTLTLISEKNA